MARATVLACAAALLTAAGSQTAPSAWFGTWKLRPDTAGGKPETLRYSDAGGGAMRMVSLEDGSELVTRFDGRPAIDSGRGAGPVRTLAITATSPISYRWTFGVGGRPVARGINTLAADGRSFTEVSWAVDMPARTVKLVYERQ